MIWYTPTTSMATELNCCTKPAKLVAEVDRTFSREPTWARKRVDSSHLVCMEPSAPWILTVSSAARLSTSKALRCEEARRVVSDSSSILCCISNA